MTRRRRQQVPPPAFRKVMDMQGGIFCAKEEQLRIWQMVLVQEIRTEREADVVKDNCVYAKACTRSSQSRCGVFLGKRQRHDSKTDAEQCRRSLYIQLLKRTDRDHVQRKVRDMVEFWERAGKPYAMFGRTLFKPT